MFDAERLVESNAHVIAGQNVHVPDTLDARAVILWPVGS